MKAWLGVGWRQWVRRVTRLLWAAAVLAFLGRWLLGSPSGGVWAVATVLFLVASLVDTAVGQAPLPEVPVRLVDRRADGGWDVMDGKGQSYDVTVPRRWRGSGDDLAVGDLVMARIDRRYQGADLMGWRGPARRPSP